MVQNDEEKSVLIRAVEVAAVALLVVGVPGYAWSRVLFGALDRVERCSLTVALSLCLVPVAALALSVPFGPGITLPIAVSSIVLVTVTGIAAWLRFGGAGTTQRAPVSPQPPPLPGWSLALLTAAAVPMLGVALGLLPGRRAVLPVGLLVLLSAILYIPTLGRCSSDATSGTVGNPAEPPGHPDARRPALLVASRAFVGLVLLLVLARGYAGPVQHDWPYLRGQDIYAHSVMANLVLTSGSASDFLVYPPGLHVLTAVLARLTDTPPLNIYYVLAPALILLPALASYSLALRLFGHAAAVGASALAGLVLTSPWYYVRNSTYADLIAAQFLLVLVVLALALLVCSPSLRHAILFALLGSGVALFHSVASIYLALFLAAFGLVALPYLLLRDRPRGLVLTGAMTLLAALALAYVWAPYDVPRTIAAFLGLASQTGTTSHASMAIGTQKPVPLRSAPTSLGQGIFWLGLFGLLVLSAMLRNIRGPRALAVALLPLWCLIMFAGSLTSLSGFPTRFHRDLGVPLSILAALAAVLVLRSVTLRRPASVTAASLLALVCVISGSRLLTQAAAPSTYLYMTPGIEAAGEWLRANNMGGRLVVSPAGNQVPANSMLAMGNYSGLPAYTAKQLRDPRAVPHRDRQEARDVLAILKRPYATKTLQLLRRYDADYLVIYKRFRQNSYWENKISVDWRVFKRRTGPYRVAFENEDVLILHVDTGGQG